MVKNWTVNAGMGLALGMSVLLTGCNKPWTNPKIPPSSSELAERPDGFSAVQPSYIAVDHRTGLCFKGSDNSHIFTYVACDPQVARMLDKKDFAKKEATQYLFDIRDGNCMLVSTVEGGGFTTVPCTEAVIKQLPEAQKSFANRAIPTIAGPAYPAVSKVPVMSNVLPK